MPASEGLSVKNIMNVCECVVVSSVSSAVC